jgi:methionine synthase I (cobalamin-dependent)
LLDVRKKLDDGILIGDGAGVLEANTFSDNHLKLATHGFEVNVNEISVEAHGRRAYLMPPASMPHLAGDVVEAIN